MRCKIRNLALLWVQKSYGKGTVQSVVQGLDEEGLKITIARYHTPNDRVIDGIGIIPDEIVEPSKANPEEDVQLGTGLLKL